MSLLNVLPYCFCFMFLGHKACGILTAQPGTEPSSLALEDKVLITGPPGKSLLLRLHKSRNTIASCGNYSRIQIFLPVGLFYLKLPNLAITFSLHLCCSCFHLSFTVRGAQHCPLPQAHTQAHTFTTIVSRKVTVTLFHFLCTPVQLMFHLVSSKSGYVIRLSLTKKVLCCSDSQQGWQMFSVKGQAVSILNIAGLVDDFSAQPL